MHITTLINELLTVGREERYAEIATLPGAGIHREVLKIAGSGLDLVIPFAKALAAADRSAFIKAVAVFEDTAGGLGSVTAIQRLLPLLGDEHDEVLEWILRNTNSYWYYSHGAKSLVELERLRMGIAQRRADSLAKEKQRETDAKERIAAKATHDLYNAVRRGDLKAVQGLLAKGADTNVLAPDGGSLLSLAIANQRPDIAAELQSKKPHRHHGDDNE